MTTPPHLGPRLSPSLPLTLAPNLPPYSRLYADARTHRLESRVLWNQGLVFSAKPYTDYAYYAPGEYYAAVFTLDDSEVQCCVVS